jgi:hypothetical protein
MVLLYGCAGRLTAKNGGFWPGQYPGDPRALGHVPFSQAHCPTSTVFGPGSPSTLWSGLYSCCAENTFSENMAEAYSFAGAIFFGAISPGRGCH